jgi:hypothetical protein
MNEGEGPATGTRHCLRGRPRGHRWVPCNHIHGSSATTRQAALARPPNGPAPDCSIRTLRRVDCRMHGFYVLLAAVSGGTGVAERALCQ